MKINSMKSSKNISMAKQYGRDHDGEMYKTNYPMNKNFDSEEHQVEEINDLFEIVRQKGEEGACLLKGELGRPLNNESRAGHTNPEALTEWLVIDNDSLPQYSPESLVELLGISDVDYIVQYSASAGIAGTPNRYHLFFLLDKGVSPSDIKLLVKKWNLTIPEIRDAIELSKTKQALRWPLDITVNQNDKLIFIAPPELRDGITADLPGPRYQLMTNKKRRLMLDTRTLSEEVIRILETECINKLRADENLMPREFATRKYKNLEVAKDPEAVQITGVKEERGFRYYDFNGGDSMSAYHPITKPEVIYSFKGEPPYLTKELVPDFYEDIKARADTARSEQRKAKKVDVTHEYIRQQGRYFEEKKSLKGRAFLAFRDRRTDQYYVGYYDYDEERGEFYPTNSKSKASDYLLENGCPAPELIPTWDYEFDPSILETFLPARQFVNRFEPSQYLFKATKSKNTLVPPYVNRLVDHALGGDPEMIEHFWNWLACIFQYRIKTKTAWVLQGTTGTGKGMLMDKVIRPLLGDAHCRIVMLANMDDNFNAYMENTLVLFVDEVDTDQVRDMATMMARLKNMITESTLGIRAMRTDLREALNYINLIMASNQPNSMRIESNDRRFNVCPRQEQPLFRESENKAAFVEALEEELPALAEYLISREANRAKASIALENDAKRQMQKVTESAMEEVAEALRDGDLAYFAEYAKPQGPGYLEHPFTSLIQAAVDAALEGRTHFLLLDDLKTLFEELMGKLGDSRAKFKKRLLHHRIVYPEHPKKVGKTSHRGYPVSWVARKSELKAWKKQLRQEEKPLRRVV